ncbi:hypothetical protein E2I00_005455, partial [Balaenoptera physalus]
MEGLEMPSGTMQPPKLDRVTIQEPTAPLLPPAQVKPGEMQEEGTNSGKEPYPTPSGRLDDVCRKCQHLHSDREASGAAPGRTLAGAPDRRGSPLGAGGTDSLSGQLDTQLSVTEDECQSRKRCLEISERTKEGGNWIQRQLSIRGNTVNLNNSSWKDVENQMRYIPGEWNKVNAAGGWTEGGFEALEVSAYTLWSLESQMYLRNCCCTGLGAPVDVEKGKKEDTGGSGGSYSTETQFSPEEQRTKALKFMLLNL